MSQNELYPERPRVNLQSLLVGNGCASPLDTRFGYWETLCTTNPGVDKPVFNATRCDIIAENLPRCIDVSQACYDHPDPAICATAKQVCYDGVMKHYDGEAGRNRFDITAPCKTPDDSCYFELERINKFLNSPWVFQELSVPPEVKNFTFDSGDVYDAFAAGNDLGISTQPQVKFLLESGIDVLLYQGNSDIACNTAGNIRWASNMPWKGQPAFVAQERQKLHLAKEGQGWYKQVKVRTAGERNVTFGFAALNGAGHLVPYDKPAEALDLVNRWIFERSLA